MCRGASGWAVLPLLSSLLAGLCRGGWRGGRAASLLAGRVGLALLAVGRTGRLIRQTPGGRRRARGMEDERKSGRMRGWKQSNTQGEEGREGATWPWVHAVLYG